MDIVDVILTLGLVLLGAFAAVLQLVVEVRTNGDEKTAREFSLRDYLGLYPYKTLLSIITAFGGAAGLYAAGELTMVTAFSIGYIGQSVGRVGKK